MLDVKLDGATGLAVLEPHGELSAEDFKSAAKIVDPYILEHGHLNGLLIHAESFPGWDSFAAFSKHLEFVKNHHKQIKRIAIATDSKLGYFAENIASHFVKAEIKCFAYKQMHEAEAWLVE
jgi:hypothetical protein